MHLCFVQAGNNSVVVNMILLQVSSFNLITMIMDCPFKLTFDYGVSVYILGKGNLSQVLKHRILRNIFSILQNSTSISLCLDLKLYIVMWLVGSILS